MSCPFKHMWAEGLEAPPDDANHNSINKTILNPPSHEEDKRSKPTETSQASKQICHMGFGKGATAAASGSAGPAATVAPAVAGKCPLGYGSSSGPKLSALHCIICKSLLFDCVITNCGHRFCSQCIGRFRDCPACGADVESISPDPETQGTVDKFLEVHAGDSSIWEMEGTATAADKEAISQEERGKAAFLLQIGLRAMSGGNYSSAIARLKQCRECLESDLAAAEEGAAAEGGKGEDVDGFAKASHLRTSSTYITNCTTNSTTAAALRSKLGAICGCAGDCNRIIGNIPEALPAYDASVAYLRVVATTDNTEAQQALSVTLNKIAEVHHSNGDVLHAIPLYMESLELRKTRFEGMKNMKDKSIINSEEGVSAGLDLAISQAKVADALRESGQQGDECVKYLIDAEDVLRSIQPGVAGAPEALQRKFQMVWEHVHGSK